MPDTNCADLELIEGFLIPNKFDVILPKMLLKFGNNVQAVSIPAFSIGMATQPSPVGAVIKLPGDSPDYSDLQITFIMDQNLVIYDAVLKWMKACSYPEDPSQYANFVEQYVSYDNQKDFDVLSQPLIVQSKSGVDHDMIWTFNDVFPMAMGGLEFSTTLTDASITTMNVTFAYNTFTVGRAGQSQSF